VEVLVKAQGEVLAEEWVGVGVLRGQDMSLTSNLQTMTKRKIKMVRPRRRRRIRYCPEVTYFKPRGVALQNLDEEILAADELEALRLRYVKNLEQVEAAKKMNVSQATFHRILRSANRKMARAIVKGKAIRVEGHGNCQVGPRGCLQYR
jgi:predicted DNA-binding protein (UPF0251 family)